jgi:hypothetical protein
VVRVRNTNLERIISECTLLSVGRVLFVCKKVNVLSSTSIATISDILVQAYFVTHLGVFYLS